MSSVTGSARTKAKDFVDAFQNPFGKDLSTLYDPIKKAKDAGTLKYEDANDALTNFNEKWSAFESAASQWKEKGGDFKTAVDQAYDPKGDFMKTVDMVRSDLTGWTGSLKPADDGKGTGASSAPDLKTILTSLGLTPEGEGDAAAKQQKKKSAAATSTILTGGKGLDPLKSGNRKYTTLLGY